MLIDGNSLTYRAFFALAALRGLARSDTAAARAAIDRAAASDPDDSVRAFAKRIAGQRG